MAEQQNKVQEQDVNQLRKVRREKLADLQSNGKNPFEITKFDVTCHAVDIKEHFEEMEGKQVTLAGRVMQKRVMGKASFCNVLGRRTDGADNRRFHKYRLCGDTPVAARARD